MNNRGTALTLTQVALGAALMVICSMISIPAAVPFTLQTFGVFTLLIVLGGKKGTMAIGLYILLGLVGLPVFSGGRGGPAALFGATGGYILGFLLTGVCCILFERRWPHSSVAQWISLSLGLVLCYAFGTAWFLRVYTGEMTLAKALSWCVWPFILPDLVKLVLAMAVGRRVKRALGDKI